MDSLETEILKYEKKGFEVVQRRTLKHGLRVFLKRENEEIFLTFNCVYLYYVNGNATLDSFRECLKDYDRFYEDEDFDVDEGDKGFFLCSGSLDEKLFKDLRKAMLGEEIRNSIKAVSLAGEIIAQPRREKEPTKIVEKAGRISLEKVLDSVKSTPLVPQPKERAYEAQLYASLNARGFPVDYESQRKGARFDLVVGDIAIELKIVKNSSIFDGLYGQVSRYHDQFSSIIIVLIDQFRNPSIMNNEIERLKKISPGNIKVVVK
jgi:hypothetical protein